jgi:hypothetical protein
MLTAQMPATVATIALDITICLGPFVLRNTAPLMAPAAMLFDASSEKYQHCQLPFADTYAFL